MSETMTTETAGATPFAEMAPDRTDTAMVIAEPRELVANGAAPEVDWERLEREAALVATHPGLAKEFADPTACRFIAYKSQVWGTDVVATAEKTYFTPRKGGGLNVGYESQLIHAIVQGDPDLMGPLEISFGYAGDQRILANRFCKVSGWLRGAQRPAEYISPTFAQIKVKNSPLWFSDTDQQLSYYSVRGWARRHRPGRILGLYSRDEIEAIADRRDATRDPLESMAEPDFGDKPTEVVGASAARGDDNAQDRAEPPPVGDTPNEPADMAEIRAWAEAERLRIVALQDVAEVAEAGNAMLKDARFRRLIAYDQPEARRIDRSIKKHLADLEAG